MWVKMLENTPLIAGNSGQIIAADEFQAGREPPIAAVGVRLPDWFWGKRRRAERRQLKEDRQRCDEIAVSGDFALLRRSGSAGSEFATPRHSREKHDSLRTLRHRCRGVSRRRGNGSTLVGGGRPNIKTLLAHLPRRGANRM